MLRSLLGSSLLLNPPASWLSFFPFSGCCFLTQKVGRVFCTSAQCVKQSAGSVHGAGSLKLTVCSLTMFFSGPFTLTEGTG